MAPVVVSQPVPPSWKDLGKAAGDLLSKDYPIHGNSLEVKTKTPNGVTFRVLGIRDSKSQAINGDLEAKWEDRKNGVTFTQAWSTANVLRNHIELENHIAKGLKLELVSTLVPEKQTKNALFASTYKQPGLHTRQHLDLFKGPTFTADAVLGRDGFLAGAEASYDVKAGKLSRYNLGAGFHAPDYAVTFHGLGNLSTYSASYYHRVNADTEAGARATYDSKSPNSNVNLEVGTKTYLDNAAFVKAKINNAGILCLGYTQALRPGVKASFGLALDTVKLSDSNASANAHKLGASVTFEA
ncbi:outer mitochondrial membrane protein [Pseudozyma hubeiensis SY62]|uniref:Outer mitochondrial membrane protein n=1 Tax=Pseudozyma hubeiensis (strain SY62) TaxID=1305764 RepID=R9P0M8_PSEHS|nr:outer mitochondrial membrane protein [Pseudozyma hubeiensis SY62]KAJ9475706.1 Mitochondrial outer membrane protein porin 1 [Pseudozyma hubeiensis]GAC94669.1 outer mitochondrial membrane protein [Pseudozyma hubeiensis SY62]